MENINAGPVERDDEAFRADDIDPDIDAADGSDSDNEENDVMDVTDDSEHSSEESEDSEDMDLGPAEIDWSNRWDEPDTRVPSAEYLAWEAKMKPIIAAMGDEERNPFDVNRYCADIINKLESSGNNTATTGAEVCAGSSRAEVGCLLSAPSAMATDNQIAVETSKQDEEDEEEEEEVVLKLDHE